MKEKISFVSEQATSQFLIGQLFHTIFAYYHFLELVVTVCGEDCVANHRESTLEWPSAACVAGAT